MSSLSSISFFPESSSSNFLPHDVVNIVGEFLEPEDMHDSPSLYKNYQHASLRMELYKTLHGQLPSAQRTLYTEAQIQEIRLRTEHLEDWAVLYCFMAYCKRHPQSEDSEAKIRFQAQLCLRGNKTALYPLADRVQRLIHFYPLSYPFLRSLSANDFLPGASDLLEPLVNSIVEIPLNMLSRHHIPQSSEPLPVRRRPFRELIKALAIHTFSTVLIAGSIILYTAIKIAVFMASTILICAVISPFFITGGALANGSLLVPTSMRGLKDYTIFCMGLGAMIGAGYSIYKTLPYIKTLWKTRHLTVQLHKESFRAFKRLWVDYTRTFGYSTGSWQLITAVLKSHKTLHPFVVRVGNY